MQGNLSGTLKLEFDFGGLRVTLSPRPQTTTHTEFFWLASSDLCFRLTRFLLEIVGTSAGCFGFGGHPLDSV